MNKSKTGTHDISSYTVCGLVVLSRSAQFDELKTEMSNIPNLEVHISDSNGRFAITVEEYPGTTFISDQIETIRNLSGVVDISLAYTHSEPLG